jgi:hypothetical protein
MPRNRLAGGRRLAMNLALRRAAAVAFAVSVIAAPIALAGDTRTDAPPAPVTYAIIGDTPYGTPQVTNFPNDVAEINADPNVRAVVHLGDIKNGSSECNNLSFQTIRADFDKFADPLIYTPGDNEWTDCHRTNNGGYLPNERLDTLRRLFFDMPGHTLGDRSMTLDVQNEPFVESVSWSAAGVQWGTLNVPGSNNDWQPWFGVTPLSHAQVEEFKKRNDADLKWLRSIFDSARKGHAAAVVLGIQANMWDPAFSGANDSPGSYDHFTDFVQELAKQAREFAKPVLLFNGDSHEFTDDTPLSASAPAYQLSMYGLTAPVPNLRRITVNGSTTPCHEWLKLTVDPSTADILSYERIRFHNQPGFPPALCPAS